MTKRFPRRRPANSIEPFPPRRPRHSSVVIVILVIVQSVAVAALGWEAPAIISIIVAPVVVLRPTRAYCPRHA
jgi:hypothetical protein